MRKDSTSVLKTRSATVGAAERELVREMGDAMDTSENLPVTLAQRRRVKDFQLAFDVDEEVVEEHAYWRDPEMKAQCDATHASPLEGADAAIFAGAIDQRNTALG